MPVTFKKAIHYLRNHTNFEESPVLLSVLTTIRKSVDHASIKIINALRKSGCLKKLATILQQGNCNTTYINLILSIIGNCLHDRVYAKQAITHDKIVLIVYVVLQKNLTHDSICGRIYRIIGNICQHRDNWEVLIISREPKLVDYIVKTVQKASEGNSDVSLDTLTVALRAIRQFVNSRTIAVLIKKFQVLKIIGSLFIKINTEWKETGNNANLLLDIIRVLREYSSYNYYPSIVQMRETSRGDALIHLTDVLTLSPKYVVKIVINLIHTCQRKSELPSTEVCVKFVEILKVLMENKDYTCEFYDYLKCLCLLIQNSQGEVCKKGIPLLVEILVGFKNPDDRSIELCTAIIHTMGKIRYNNRDILYDVGDDVIPALLEKLIWIVGPPDNIFTYNKHTSLVDTTYSTVPSFSKSIDFKRQNSVIQLIGDIDYNDDEMNYSMSDSSVSPNSTVSFSSDSINSFTSLINESDSENYSPVCSEVETEIEEKRRRNCNNSTDNQNKRDNGVVRLKCWKQYLKISILILLDNYMINSKYKVLHCIDFLAQLIKCEISTNSVIKDIVYKCLRLVPYEFFQLDFAEKLHTIDLYGPPHSLESCTECKQITKMARVILGLLDKIVENEELNRTATFVHDNRNSKNEPLLAVPFLISNGATLRFILTHHNNYKTLFEKLRSFDDDKRCIKYLHALLKSTNSNIYKISKQSKNIKYYLNRPPQNLGELTFSNTVNFILDDGSITKCYRNFLIERSVYFKSLLDGHFKETNQNNIHLSGIESETFRFLLFLFEHPPQTTNNNADNFEYPEIELLLDTILLCEQYLLFDLKKKLLKYIDKRLSCYTIASIYTWSIKANSDIIRQHCIMFLFRLKLSEVMNCKIIENIFDDSCKENLFEDFEKNYAKSRRAKCDDGHYV